MSRIEHFALFTDDLETLRAFYVEAMGLRVAVDNSRAPVAGYFLADDRGVALEIIQRPAGTPAPETRYACHAAFLVEDVVAARARLADRGCAFEEETAIDTEDFRTAFFRDPAGNRCQIVWRRSPLVPE
jgi:glyoxylase I family protein